MSRLALAALLVVTGCGSSAESTGPAEDRSNEHRSNPHRAHSGGETPCAEARSAPAPLGLDGRWFFMEPDDDDVLMVIDLAGGAGRAWEDDPSETIEARVTARDDGLHELVLRAPDRDDALRILLAPSGPGAAIAMMPGDDDALFARRAGPVPAFLAGEWRVADPRGREPAMRVSVSADGATFVTEEEQVTVRAWGLASHGPTTDIAMQRTGERGSEMRWMSLQRLEADVLIVREGGADEFRVMHRPGAPPAWLADMQQPRRGPGATGAPPPPPMN